MKPLFISHASVDRHLVDAFVERIVRLGAGVSPEAIFYSSGRDTGVPTGADLNAFVRARASDAGLVVAIITPAFESSAYCLAELGAAWATADALFPMTLPTMRATDLSGVLSGVMVRTLDDEGALDELHDRVCNATGTKVSPSTWGAQKNAWLQALPGLLADRSPNGGARLGPVEHRRDNNRAEQFAWGDLFDTFVDAALYLEDETTLASEEIREAIRLGLIVPTRYHYASDTGAKRWLKLCNDAGYRHHVRTKSYWASDDGRAMAGRVVEEIDSDAFDFVSLGPGDGRKDASLASHWLADGLDLFYLPYDVSLRLVAHAIHEVRRAASVAHPGSLHIKAVVADFHHFDTIGDVFAHRSAPNVVALLGTLGNLDNEQEFLQRLASRMGPSDLLLLEVRLRSDSALGGLNSDTSFEHDFGPLEYYLGLKYDADQIHVQPVDRPRSTIRNTVTYAVTYTGNTGLPFAHRDVNLQYIHTYDRESFLTELDRWGFDVLEHATDQEQTFLECLLRRKKKVVAPSNGRPRPPRA